jgi:hypothetical protein
MLAAMLMSRRATALMLADMFGAKPSTGSVKKILKDASASSLSGQAPDRGAGQRLGAAGRLARAQGRAGSTER